MAKKQKNRVSILTKCQYPVTEPKGYPFKVKAAFGSLVVADGCAITRGQIVIRVPAISTLSPSTNYCPALTSCSPLQMDSSATERASQSWLPGLTSSTCAGLRWTRIAYAVSSSVSPFSPRLSATVTLAQRAPAGV